MKKTGMIRRIDNLGRIVIPKEIRTNFGLKTGSPMEIGISKEGEIVLNACDVSRALEDNSDWIMEVVKDVYTKQLVVCTQHKIVAQVGLGNKYIDKTITRQLSQLVESYDTLDPNTLEVELLLIDDDKYITKYIAPIMSGIMCVGLVILLDNNIEPCDRQVAKLISGLLSKQVE